MRPSIKEKKTPKEYLRQLAAFVIASMDEFGLVFCIDAV
jgi:hypothetical protein